MAKGKYDNWITEEGLLKIEGWARDGLTDEQIAYNIGIAYSTLRVWKDKYPALSAALKKGKDVVDRQVENALLKRALGYEYEEVTYERIIDTMEAERHDGVQELTADQWEMAQQYFGMRCCYCGAKEKMTKDHVIPLSAGGLMEMRNILPACSRCNSSKGSKPMKDWFLAQSFYSDERMERICDYKSFVSSYLCRNGEVGLVETKRIRKYAMPDTTAQIFWLKNRKPDEWRDKQGIEISGLAAEQSKLSELLEQRKARQEAADEGRS